jgi:predicted amidophosphoribosyltransferase
MQKLGPHHCDYCRLAMPPSETIWCSYCLALIKSVPRCQRCGLQTEHEAEQCGECLTDPPLWDRLFCIGNYTDPLKEYVNGLKYGQKFWYAHDLTSLLVPRISTPAPLLLPVPLHWKRRWWRSYNQSAMLAWALEKQLKPALSALMFILFVERVSVLSKTASHLTPSFAIKLALF